MNYLVRMNVDLLSSSLVTFMAILTLIGLYKGARRGFSRQLVRFITIIASVFLSVYLVRLGSTAFMAWVDGQSTSDIIEFVDSLGFPFSESFVGKLISYVDTSTANYILAIPLALVIAPVSFSLCFIVVSGLMLIVHAIVAGIFGFFKRRNNALTRFFGLLLGALQGALVSLILIAPLAGILSNATEAIEAHRNNTEESSTAIEYYDEYIEPFTEIPLIKASGAIGGNLIYDLLSTVTIDGVKYKMADTVATPALKISMAIENFGDFDWKSATEENERALRDIIEAFDDSDYTAILLSDVLSSFSAAYADGVVSFDLPSPLDEVVGAAVGAFGGIDKDSLPATLNTAADAYFLLSKEGVLFALEGDPDAVTDILTRKDENGETVVNKVIAILKSNERTRPIVVTLTKISVSSMANKLGTGEDTAAIYENVKSGVNETLKIKKTDYQSTEEYTAAVSASLDQTLTDNGIELEADIVDSMAQYVTDNYSDVESVTDEELNDIILSYYDAYVDYIDN